MSNVKDLLQKARQDWVSEQISKLGIEFPIAEISKKMGKGTGYVSMYISHKRAMSVNFMRAFCEVYDYNFDAVNHMLIEKIKNQIIEDQSKDEKSSNDSKINVGTHFDKSLTDNTFEALNLKTKGYIPMKDFMEMYRKEKEQMNELLLQNRMLIEQNGVLMRKIPDASIEGVTGKRRHVG